VSCGRREAKLESVDPTSLDFFHLPHRRSHSSAFMIRSTALLRPRLHPQQSPCAIQSLRVARSPFSRPYAQKSWADEGDSKDVPREPKTWLGGQQRESWSAPVRKLSSKQRQRQPQPQQNLPPSKEDLERYRQVRVRRAERLERRDLTAQMTETKTCAFASTFRILSLFRSALLLSTRRHGRFHSASTLPVP
jgi:hypothetical protein